MVNEFQIPLDSAAAPNSSVDSSALSALHRQALSVMSAVERTASLAGSFSSPFAPQEQNSTIVRTPELKTALDAAPSVVLKMETNNNSRADMVVKRDGSIEHYLNMDAASQRNRDLVIAVERDDTGTNSLAEPLTESQKKTLSELKEYLCDSQKKFTVNDIELETKKETNKGEGDNDKSNKENDGKENGKENYKKLSDIFKDSDIFKTFERNRNYSGPMRRATDSGASRVASASDYSPGASSAGRFSASDYSPRSVSPGPYFPAARIDWNQIDLFDLMMDWFGADEEAFKELMPGLFKKIFGPNGKIDPKKLRRLVDSKDPGLKELRKELPRLAESFPNSRIIRELTSSAGDGNSSSQSGDRSSSSHEKVSSCSDAVNATGAVLADKAAQVSSELGTYGYCAKGVSFAIERATGKIIWGNANDMRKTLPSEGFTETQSKNLKVGQVVHVYWTPEVYAQEQARRGPCPNYGDIAIIGKGEDGQLYAYNDAATPLNDYLQKSRYDWNTLKVFNPPNS